MNKNILISLSIIAFRIADLISTHFALLGQPNLENEFNLIVQIFNINSKFSFYIIEILLALLLIGLYLFSSRNSKVFNFNATNFKQYCSEIIRRKNRKLSYKNLIVIIGKAIPSFIIITSIIYIINNILVYLGNTSKYYYDLYYTIDKIIPFEFIIFGFPPVIFITIIILVLNKNYIDNKNENVEINAPQQRV